MHVAGPEIASLLLRSLRRAHRAVHRGEFGPIVGRRGKADLVELVAVERHVGLRFTLAQLAAAGVHLPEPVLPLSFIPLKANGKDSQTRRISQVCHVLKPKYSLPMLKCWAAMKLSGLHARLR